MKISETKLNKIVDIYMQSLNRVPIAGWQEHAFYLPEINEIKIVEGFEWSRRHMRPISGEYLGPLENGLITYFFNPRDKFIMFPRVTITFKQEDSREFDEDNEYKLEPKTKRGIRNALKREILRRLNHPHSYQSMKKIEKILMSSFKKVYGATFKVHLSNEEPFIYKVWCGGSFSIKEARNKAWMNLGSSFTENIEKADLIKFE